MYSYASLDTLKSLANITGTGDDAQFKRVLEAVTRQVDAFCHRTFRTYLDSLKQETLNLRRI